MNELKAVIFDVYSTLLDVSARGDDVEKLWQDLHAEVFGRPADMSLVHLAERCDHLVSEDHADAHHCGIAHPEVVWADVMARALPGFSQLDHRRAEDFLFSHIQLLRTLRLPARAPEVLADCRDRGLLLGIVSNAQPYTLRELQEVLAPAGLEVFARDLSLWSWELGFSKPDPYIFRLLRFRLAARGIRPEETMVVGDRLDNDIEPARAQGFQTWWLHESPGGGWDALIEARFPHLVVETEEQP